MAAVGAGRGGRVHINSPAPGLQPHVGEAAPIDHPPAFFTSEGSELQGPGMPESSPSSSREEPEAWSFLYPLRHRPFLVAPEPPSPLPHCHLPSNPAEDTPLPTVSVIRAPHLGPLLRDPQHALKLFGKNHQLMQ